MNLNKLPITDDLQEQIALGRELMDSYDHEMLNYIKALYDKVDESKLPMTKDELLCKQPMIIGCMDLLLNNNFIFI